MKAIDFWFDPVSPYAWLAFERLPEALVGVSHVVHYRPILFAGLLKHWGQKGPAEIDPKRDWTFRHVAWLARRHGLALEPPRPHPFNPLPLLRLLLAAAPPGATPGRHACEQVLRHVWQGGGADAVDPARLAELTTRLAPRAEPGADAVKQALRDATARAVAAGVFGVPTFRVDGASFWGLDALPMLVEHLGRAAEPPRPESAPAVTIPR